MTFAHLLPWWALAAALLAILVVVVASYRHRPEGRSRGRALWLGVMRALVLILLLALWMRPVRFEPAGDASGRLVALLVDVSKSMSLPVASGATRLDAALALAREHAVPALAGEFDVEAFAFGASARRLDLDAAPIDAADGSSDLDAALTELRSRLAGRQLAGVLVLSDGGLTDRVDDGRVADGPPVFAIGIGDPGTVRDREVAGLALGEAAVAGSNADLTATLVGRGFGGGEVDVRVLQDGRPIEVRRVRLPGDDTPVRQTFRVSPGRELPTVFTVEVVADATEITADNNRRSVLAPPAGRPRTLLMLEGAPGHEHSFLKRAWADDPGLQVDAVVRKGRNEDGEDTYYVQGDRMRTAALGTGFPSSREALFAYDAVVLANLEADALTRAQLDAIEAFVAERGGGVLVLGARSFDGRSLAGTPLERVLPLDVSDRGREVARVTSTTRTPNAVALTAEGEDHPIMRLGPTPESTRAAWAQVPLLAAVSPLGGPRPGALVLAATAGPGGNTRPLVAVQQYGEGRSMAFVGEAAWRWKMLLPSTDRTYDTFWRQAARWLAGRAPEPIDLQITPVSAAEAHVRVDVRSRTFEPLRDAVVSLRVAGPGSEPRDLALSADPSAPGVWTGRVSAAESGTFQMDVVAVRAGQPAGAARGWWLAGGFDAEMADPRRDDRALARVAAAGGGRLIEADEIALLPAWLRAARPADAPLAQRDLWHTPWVLLFIVGVLCAEWALRRRWGWR